MDSPQTTGSGLTMDGEDIDRMPAYPTYFHDKLVLVDRKTKQGNMLRTKYSSLVIKDQTNY